jgi:hypothetical protein
MKKDYQNLWDKVTDFIIDNLGLVIAILTAVLLFGGIIGYLHLGNSGGGSEETIHKTKVISIPNNTDSLTIIIKYHD